MAWDNNTLNLKMHDNNVNNIKNNEKERDGNKTWEKGVMHNMIAAAVYILGMVFYGVEHPSGQVRSPAPAMLPPSFLCSSSLAGHGTLKPLDLLSALFSSCQNINVSSTLSPYWIQNSALCPCWNQDSYSLQDCPSVRESREGLFQWRNWLHKYASTYL